MQGKLGVAIVYAATIEQKLLHQKISTHAEEYNFVSGASNEYFFF